MIDTLKQAQSFDELITLLTPEVYQQLKTAVEIGKWHTGQPLSKEQRALCLQAVIAYEKNYVNEQDRSGYVPPKNTPCGDKDNDGEQVITVQ